MTPQNEYTARVARAAELSLLTSRVALVLSLSTLLAHLWGIFGGGS